jgi:hypothetical protein
MPGSSGGYDLGLNGTRWGDVYIKDSKKIKFGDSNDLEIYHDGSHSYIDHSGTGNIHIRGNGADDVKIQAKNGEQSIICHHDGGVELYHDNVEKVRTTAEGLTFNGDTAAANAIDDYEEGSFTPTIVGTNIGGYGEQYGRYVKIGKVVHISVRLYFSANTGSGAFGVGNLPFTSASGTGDNYTSGGITFCNVPLSSANYDPYITSNSTQVVFYVKNTGASVTLSSNCSDKYLGLGAFYFV